jgi:hypothetical protein
MLCQRFPYGNADAPADVYLGLPVEMLLLDILFCGSFDLAIALVWRFFIKWLAWLTAKALNIGVK